MAKILNNKINTLMLLYKIYLQVKIANFISVNMLNYLNSGNVSKINGIIKTSNLCSLINFKQDKAKIKNL